LKSPAKPGFFRFRRGADAAFDRSSGSFGRRQDGQKSYAAPIPEHAGEGAPDQPFTLERAALIR
jgi:hypothetical protein